MLPCVERHELKCVLCVSIDCPYSRGRVSYTVINQVAGNTSDWDVWGLNFNALTLLSSGENLSKLGV